MPKWHRGASAACRRRSCAIATTCATKCGSTPSSRSTTPTPQESSRRCSAAATAAAAAAVWHVPISLRVRFRGLALAPRPRLRPRPRPHFLSQPPPFSLFALSHLPPSLPS
eukprot:3716492-Prymnesium_polylepis.1